MMQIGVVGMGRNGYFTRIMQSQETVDKLIKDFEIAIAAGYNPNDVKNEIFAKRRVTEADLSDSDKKRLVKKVEEIYQSHKLGR